jgi:hypothetical protein
MSARKRLRRDDPVRTAPLRDFANLYRRPDQSKFVDGALNSASAHKAPRAASKRGPLAEGVELAYRVIEKHIVEGRRTAEQLNKESYGARTGADTVQNLLERMIRFQSEILPLWVEALGTIVKVDPTPAGHSTARNSAAGSNNGASNHGRTAVSIEVKSKRPVEVSLELGDHTNGSRLMTHGLRAVDPRKTPLTDVKFRPNRTKGCSTLSLRIPDKQPAGTYSGIVVDRATGDPRGTLRVRVT